MKERIEIGDTVKVVFENSYPLSDVTVLYMPSSTGDAWVLKSKNGNIHYVQQFAEIRWEKPLSDEERKHLPW